MARVHGYIRVSTTKQASSGLGLDEQKAAIEAWCQMHGHTLVNVYSDPAVSASKPFRERPSAIHLFRSIQPGDIIVVKRFDRAFRSLKDAIINAERLHDVDKVSLVILDMGGHTIDYGTAVGRFIFHTLANTAQLERELTAERTKAVRDRVLADGGWPHKWAPLGYKYVVVEGLKLRIVPDPVQLEEIRKVQAACARHNYNIEATCKEIGYRKAAWPRTASFRQKKRVGTGYQWYPSTVRECWTKKTIRTAMAINPDKPHVVTANELEATPVEKMLFDRKADSVFDIPVATTEKIEQTVSSSTGGTHSA